MLLLATTLLFAQFEFEVAAVAAWLSSLLLLVMVVACYYYFLVTLNLGVLSDVDDYLPAPLA